MAVKTTSYLATYTLSEFDMRNIALLEEKTGYNSASAIHQAVFFCQKSLDYAKSGYSTSALYETFDYRATSTPLNPRRVAEIYNSRNPGAEKIDLSLYRSSDMLQGLHDIKKTINSESDSVALSFALEYAAQMVEKLQSANNGKKAQIFFSPNNSPRDRGWTMPKHPYNISLGNSFRKASRRMKSGTAAIFKKQKPTIHTQQHKALPAPAPEQAPPQAEQQQPAPAQADSGDKMHAGISDNMKAMKPLTLKPRGDGGQGFRL